MIERALDTEKTIGLSITKEKHHEVVKTLEGETYWVYSGYVYHRPVIRLWNWNVKLPAMWRKRSDSPKAGMAERAESNN